MKLNGKSMCDCCRTPCTKVYTQKTRKGKTLEFCSEACKVKYGVKTQTTTPVKN